MHRALALLVLAAAAALGGCQVGPNEQPAPSKVDPVTLLHALPTPAGFRDDGPARVVDAAGAGTMLLGESAGTAAKTLPQDGFERAAARTWTAPDGARLTAVVVIWGDPQTAVSAVGYAAERLLSLPGAQAWTPSQIRGARGARALAASPPEQALSAAIEQNGLFARATGDVSSNALVVMIKRMALLAGGGS